jgi:heme A synthase
MTFLEIVQAIHSIVRWLVLLVALGGIIKFAVSWLRRSGDRLDRTLMAAFTGVLDLQAALGVLLIVGLGFGPETMYRIEHAITMIIAVVLAHLSMRWREAPGPIRARNNLIVTVLALVLILGGLLALPAGRGLPL